MSSADGGSSTREVTLSSGDVYLPMSVEIPPNITRHYRKLSFIIRRYLAVSIRYNTLDIRISLSFSSFKDIFFGPFVRFTVILFFYLKKLLDLYRDMEMSLIYIIKKVLWTKTYAHP